MMMSRHGGGVPTVLKPFEEIARSHGFSRLRSFTFPLVDGTPERVHRTSETVVDCVVADPTLMMYTDDPATILFIDKLSRTVDADPLSLSPVELARAQARDPSSVDRSFVLFVYGADGSTQFTRLHKTHPESPDCFDEALRMRGRHLGDECVVCYEPCDVVSCCRRCTATMCMDCDRKNNIFADARCPLCRQSKRYGPDPADPGGEGGGGGRDYYTIYDLDDQDILTQVGRAP